MELLGLNPAIRTQSCHFLITADRRVPCAVQSSRPTQLNSVVLYILQVGVSAGVHTTCAARLEAVARTHRNDMGQAATKHTAGGTDTLELLEAVSMIVC